MARRRSSSNGDESILGVAGLGLIALLQFIKPILALLVNVLAVTGLPVFLILYHAASKKRAVVQSDPKSRIPDPGLFDWDEEKAKIHVISTAIEDAEAKVAAIYSYAKKSGLRRTDASDGKRFDQRRKEGSEFNKTLDKLDAHIDRLVGLRDNERRAVHSRVPAWRDAHNVVITSESSWGAAKLSLLAYLVVLVVLSAWRPSWVQYLSGLAHSASGTLGVLFGQAALGTIAAWAGFLYFRSRFRGRLDETVHTVEVHAWEQIEYEIGNNDFFEEAVLIEESSESTGDPEGSAEDSTPSGPLIDGRTWYAILGVQQDASPEEIKVARRRRIQKYHPDNVASLGPRLLALAEAETVAVNRAYQLVKQIGRV